LLRFCEQLGDAPASLLSTPWIVEIEIDNDVMKPIGLGLHSLHERKRDDTRVQDVRNEAGTSFAAIRISDVVVHTLNSV
jgi:hypothetical protein